MFFTFSLAFFQYPHIRQAGYFADVNFHHWQWFKSRCVSSKLVLIYILSLQMTNVCKISQIFTNSAFSDTFDSLLLPKTLWVFNLFFIFHLYNEAFIYHHVILESWILPRVFIVYVFAVYWKKLMHQKCVTFAGKEHINGIKPKQNIIKCLW